MSDTRNMWPLIRSVWSQRRGSQLRMLMVISWQPLQAPFSREKSCRSSLPNLTCMFLVLEPFQSSHYPTFCPTWLVCSALFFVAVSCHFICILTLSAPAKCQHMLNIILLCCDVDGFDASSRFIYSKFVIKISIMPTKVNLLFESSKFLAAMWHPFVAAW